MNCHIVIHILRAWIKIYFFTFYEIKFFTVYKRLSDIVNSLFERVKGGGLNYIIKSGINLDRIESTPIKFSIIILKL